MKITENGSKGETVLTVSDDELEFLRCALNGAKQKGFTSGALSHDELHTATALVADLKDFQDYKRLREKFRRQVAVAAEEYECRRQVAAVQSAFRGRDERSDAHVAGY